jgi:hypothetical protein
MADILATGDEDMLTLKRPKDVVIVGSRDSYR